ncbi:MAG TPA: Crp/Fnr family transcriptional regulator [Candidatus Omnitrophota bacterium]|nr:Crp/Fnr family transcriptional regulator [Candidatus Omnitrophota bacterium]
MNPIGNNRTLRLNDIALFRDLPTEERNAIGKCLREETFKKGEILFSEGMACERVFIVQSGRVKIFRLSSEGREQILEVLGPGDTCACNPGQACWSCSSSASAITDCSVFFLSRFNYVQMVKNNSRMAHTLSRIFAERLCRFSSLIETVSMDDPRKRLIKFILEMANHQECQCAEENCICLKMTQEEIAQRLGVTRITIARHLKQLKDLKLISSPSHSITILDKEGLNKALL